MYSFVPTSAGTLHEMLSSTGAFASTSAFSGDIFSNARVPSSSARINLPSAHNSSAFANPRCRQPIHRAQ